MRGVLGAAAAVGSLAVVAGLGATFLPPVLWPDAPVPASLAAFLEPARRQLWTEAADGLRVPVHLTFLEARCGAGGSVALVFEEHRPPYADRRFAYVARGSMPSRPEDGWSGGYGIQGSALLDAEFVHLLGRDPATCPD